MEFFFFLSPADFDNMLIAHECLDLCHKSKKPGVFCKLDFEKLITWLIFILLNCFVKNGFIEKWGLCMGWYVSNLLTFLLLLMDLVTLLNPESRNHTEHPIWGRGSPGS